MVLRLKTLSNEKMRFYALGPRHWLIVVCASKFPTQFGHYFLQFFYVKLNYGSCQTRTDISEGNMNPYLDKVQAFGSAFIPKGSQSSLNSPHLPPPWTLSGT